MTTHTDELTRSILDGEVLLPGSAAYEKAIFIGNLQYRSLRPVCVVMAESERDVQTTVCISKKLDLKLNIKNGGHSFAGYCLNDGGVVLDLTRMKNFKIHDDMSITIEGGAIWDDVYRVLKDKYVQDMIIGGQCPTVGVSGFTLGGGLSTFSRSYGLAIDSLLEMNVVMANGDLLTLSPNETDPARRDLFWALCGGGGGNFGVTTSLRTKVYRLPEKIIVAGELTWDVAESDERMRAFKKAMDTFNTMDKPNEFCMDAYWNFGDDGLRLTAQMTVIYNGTLAQCNEAIAPILEHKPDANALKEMHWTDWEREEEGFDTLSAISLHHVSFVLPEGAITPEVTNKIIELLEQSPALVKDAHGNLTNGNYVVWDHVGGVTKNVPAGATAYYWRDGVYVMTAKVQWSDTNQEAEAYAWTDMCKRVLTPYTIDRKAAYLNYIDATLDNWQAAYYGENYARLQAVKTEWDPDNFFNFKQSIELLPDDQSYKTSGDSHSASGSPSENIWQNWGQNVTAYPRSILAPVSLNEVINIVNETRERNGRIRVVGSGHSWSPLAPSNDVMLSMAAFKDIRMNEDKTRVTVGPGVTIDQLAKFFVTNKVCLPSNVGHGVGEATYGGVISTGCHGSGITMTSTSDYVVAMEVITSRGKTQTFTADKRELLDAARISLGLFGIITSITFEVQPAYNVHVVDFPQPVNEALDGLKAFVEGNKFAEFSWMPFTGTAYMNAANPTDASPTRRGQSPAISAFQDELNKQIAQTAVYALENSPESTPDILRANMKLMPWYEYVADINDYLHNSDYYPIALSKVADIEVAFEIDDDFTSVKKCFSLFKERVEAWEAHGLYPMNGSLGFRFIKNSDGLLSNSRGNEHTCLAELTSSVRTPLFQRFSGELVQTWINELPNARPHWAKGFQFMPDAPQYIKKSFGDQLSEFWAIRTQTNVDPDNLFVNDYLLDIFEG